MNEPRRQPQPPQRETRNGTENQLDHPMRHNNIFNRIRWSAAGVWAVIRAIGVDLGRLWRWIWFRPGRS